jgi:hypothetical protein
MLYTFAKTVHEQTLSSAAENPSEKPIERCSPASEFVQNFSNWYPRSVRARCAGGDRICRPPHFQALNSEAESGCVCSFFPCGNAVAGNGGPQTKGNPAAIRGSE